MRQDEKVLKTAAIMAIVVGILSIILMIVNGVPQ